MARPLLEGNQANVRVIRLATGQVLPLHRHGESDLRVRGTGELETPTGTVPFTDRCLALYRRYTAIGQHEHS